MGRLELNAVTLPRLNAEGFLGGQKRTFSSPERLRLVGASGRGKTTALMLLYGLRGGYSGEYRIEGKIAASLRDREWTELRRTFFSVVFQELRLLPALTARQNILAKSSQSRSSSDPKKLAARLGIEALLDVPVSRLSLGEQQRVAIARALAGTFRWLLLDEPFSHLDDANAEAAADLVVEISQQQGAGIIIADHDARCRIPGVREYAV